MKTTQIIPQWVTLLQQEVLPTYSTLQHGKYVYLFAHIHAMQECHIIRGVDIHNNFTAFCEELAKILHEAHFSRSKAHERFYKENCITVKLLGNIAQQQDKLMRNFAANLHHG